jgi:hypothetical protein
MVSTELRRFLNTRPFQPFTVYLADGRELDVIHPETVAISETGRIAAIYDRKDEAFEPVDLLLVTSLKPIIGKKSQQKRSR